MLFRLGLTMMSAALAICVGVILALTFNGGEPASSNEELASEAGQQPALGAAEPAPRAAEPAPRAAEPALGAAEPALGAAEPAPKDGEPVPAAEAGKEQPVEEPASERRASGSSSLAQPPRSPGYAPGNPEVLPVANDPEWPEPSNAEAEEADGPRYFPPRQDSVLTLTVDSLGLYDVPVLDSGDEAALERGVIHIPQTPMPWEEREQKNVYLAGHRVGYPNTGSRLIFYNLDKLRGGDVISLKDRSGRAYNYRVTEMFEVEPSEDWVMDTVLDRDIVTLQTCTPIPTYEKRLIVRADRIEAAASFG